MHKAVRRFVYKFGNKRRFFQMLLVFWLSASLVVMFRTNVIAFHVEQYRSLRGGNVDSVNNVSTDDVNAKTFSTSTGLQLNATSAHRVLVGGNKVGENTLTGFLNRVKTDNALLERILSQNFLHKRSKDVIRSFLTQTRYTGFDTILEQSDNVKIQQNYNVNEDTMVFLHIQKTGGTRLNKRFQMELQLPFTCKCTKKLPCTCLSGPGNMWLYTSVFAGWPCGLHADWTQLHRCIPERIDKMEGKHRDRRYFYFTQLRNPLDRYLSEWRHQSNGNHWQDAILGCGDAFSDWQDVRPCFHASDWRGVSLDNFIGCPHNLATNRQARMLADLTRTNCYRNYGSRIAMEQKAEGWVTSAMENLQKMEYFGLMEEGKKSDELFGATYGLKFRVNNLLSRSATSMSKLTEKQFMSIIQLVELDIQVYVFAQELFKRRYEKLHS